MEGSQSRPGSLGPTSVACRAAGAGLVESVANSFSKDDVPAVADSNTTGLPLAEDAVEPRDERMTGSSDVSSLCRKVGFRVTLLTPSGPATGASRVASGWPKVNIQTMVAQTRHYRMAPPRCFLSVVVDGTEMLLLLEGSIARVPPCSSWMIPLSAKRPQCDLAALLLPAAVGKQASSRPRSFHHAQPSAINAKYPAAAAAAVWSFGQAAAFPTGAHDNRVRFVVWRDLQTWDGAPFRMT